MTIIFSSDKVKEPFPVSKNAEAFINMVKPHLCDEGIYHIYFEDISTEEPILTCKKILKPIIRWELDDRSFIEERFYLKIETQQGLVAELTIAEHNLKIIKE